MNTRKPIDAAGATGLIMISSVLAMNQVVIKLTGGGFSPVFQAGLRSGLSLIVIAIWFMWQKRSLRFTGPQISWGVVSGVVFALEFIFLFNALDLTTVARASILFYTMPVWLGLAAHVLLPGEQLTRTKLLGMALAFGGVVLALAERGDGATLLGDGLALMASFCWAAIALIVRTTPQSELPPDVQLGFQLVVSAPLLLLLAAYLEQGMRDPELLHYLGLGYQVIFVASLGYLFWFHLMSIYRASSVASFSFLSPVLAVIFGWLVLGEQIGLQVWGALGLVAVGLVLINRR